MLHLLLALGWRVGVPPTSPAPGPRCRSAARAVDGRRSLRLRVLKVKLASFVRRRRVPPGHVDVVTRY